MKKVLARNRVEMMMIYTFAGLWVAGVLILRLALPQHYFQFYPVIPVIFMLFTLIITNCIKRWERKLDTGRITRAKVFNNFMIGKSIKLLSCIIIIYCYIKFIGEDTVAFVIIFMFYYLVFLAYEVLAQYSFEQREKLKKEGKGGA